jgi:hypothetical protein
MKHLIISFLVGGLLVGASAEMQAGKKTQQKTETSEKKPRKIKEQSAANALTQSSRKKEKNVAAKSGKEKSAKTKDAQATQKEVTAAVSNTEQSPTEEPRKLHSKNNAKGSAPSIAGTTNKEERKSVQTTSPTATNLKADADNDRAVGKTADGKNVFAGSRVGHYYRDGANKVHVKDFDGTKIVGKTANGQLIYEGSRGGRFYYSASGNKVYVKNN